MFKLIAHRGASKEAPENTLAAIESALAIGVDCVEIDIRLSSDHIPFVIHDRTLGRTVHSENLTSISDLDSETLKNLDAGSWFNKTYQNENIPTLEDVLSLDWGTTGLMIEIKREQVDPEKVAISLNHCLKKFPHPNAVIGSFSIPILQQIKKTLPDAALIGIAENMEQLAQMRELKLQKIAVWYKLINPTLVQSIHDEGTEIWTFTVDDLKVAQFLISIGISGIITNNPRHIKQLKLE